jgi:hypothetical protein
MHRKIEMKIFSPEICWNGPFQDGPETCRGPIRISCSRSVAIMTKLCTMIEQALWDENFPQEAKIDDDFISVNVFAPSFFLFCLTDNPGSVQGSH